MAIVWVLEWDGITQEQYEDISSRIDVEGKAPDGLQHQVAAFSEKSLLLTQVWKSPEHVLRFMEDRFLPVINELGIRTMPRVDQFVVHKIYEGK